MSTEPFEIKYSSQRYFTTMTGREANPLIEVIKDALIAGGWTLTETLVANGFLYIPGWYVNLKPLTIEGLLFVNDNCGGCGYFGTSGGCDPGDGSDTSGWFTGTLASLAANVSSCTRYNATAATNGLGLDLVAKGGGPSYNQPRIRTEIGVGFDQGGGPEVNINGGGYKLTSQAANGITQYSISVYQATVQGVVGIKIEANGGSVEYRIKTAIPSGDGVTLSFHAFGLTSIPEYMIITNPYQLIIIDTANTIDGGNAFGYGGNALLCSAPWTDNPDITFGVVVVGTGLLMNKTVWTGSNSSFAINAPLVTYSPSTFNPEPNEFGISIREFSFAQPLVTSNSKPILQNPWITAGAAIGDKASLIGRFWDAFAQSGYREKDAEVVYQTHRFHQVSRRTTAGTTSSLWFAID